MTTTTCAPRALASCTAADPTPPDAPTGSGGVRADEPSFTAAPFDVTPEMAEFNRVGSRFCVDATGTSPGTCINR